MDAHIASIRLIVPDLLDRKILDLGSGRGKFLIDMARRGVKVVGYEKSHTYVEMSRKMLTESGFGDIVVTEGMAETLPYPDGSFGFINISEVVEHVEDPRAVLMEAARVLQSGGSAYVSVPNRYGYKDPHYHLYFVNWLPRAWSETYIRFRGKQKNYDGKAGRQKLSEMHYYTLHAFRAFARSLGWEVFDIRWEKISRMSPMKRLIAMIAYVLVRQWYFDTHHFILRKGQ